MCLHDLGKFDRVYFVISLYGLNPIPCCTCCTNDFQPQVSEIAVFAVGTDPLAEPSCLLCISLKMRRPT